MFERFDDDARGVIVNISKKAGQLSQPEAMAVHLLLAMMASNKSGDMVNGLLAPLGLTHDKVSIWAVEDKGFYTEKMPAHIPWAPEIRRIIERAEKDALNWGGSAVSPLHLLWATIMEPNCSVASMLRTLGVDVAQLRIQVKNLLPQS